jgi:bisphosphoglycerate-dependent phosphoglycerate mutase
MRIEGISPEDITSLEIPTGVPMHYEFANGEISRID